LDVRNRDLEAVHRRAVLRADGADGAQARVDEIDDRVRAARGRDATGEERRESNAAEREGQAIEGAVVDAHLEGVRSGGHREKGLAVEARRLLDAGDLLRELRVFGLEVRPIAVLQASVRALD